MPSLPAHLDWINTQRRVMEQRVVGWAAINSSTDNLPGLATMAAQLVADFSVLGGQLSEIELAPYEAIGSDGRVLHRPLGKALSIIKRPEASRRVFLCIHMDTVYPADHPFQATTLLDANTLVGPGVADAKGGLAVMLTALEAFESDPNAGQLGWEILINPDEEIGSPGSAPLLKAAAVRNHLGLLFEPAMPDGALVGRRKGAGNFTVTIHGRSAHVGRDFSTGRSAIVAAANLVTDLHALNEALPGITVNVGRIDGGGPANVVPDLAICRINVRTTVLEDEGRFVEALSDLAAALDARDGLRAEVHGGFTSPPKLLDDRALALLGHVADCGQDLGLSLPWRSSGGVCDGNKLAGAGLPNIDTLGVRGGAIHSAREFLLLDSLTERARLTALLLSRLAGGDIPLPGA